MVLTEQKTCARCGKPIPKRRQKYCSEKCSEYKYQTNYDDEDTWVLSMISWQWSKKENA